MIKNTILRPVLLSAFFLTGLLLNSQVMWQIKKDTVITWYYYDGDEFDGPTVDEQKWIPAYSWTQLNYDFDYLMIPERQVFENGVCKFMCYRDTGLYTIPNWQLDSAFRKKYKTNLEGDKFRYLFTAGNVWSKSQYTKGYFEMRFKTTDSYGMWPAFWLYGSNKDEIDFFELKGERDKQVHIDVHCLKGCDDGYKSTNLLPKNWGGWIKTTENLVDGYNVISGEWQDGYVKWYLNGEGIGYYKGEFGSEKMNLIIGTGPAKNGKGFAPGVKNTSMFPNSLDVDYVRVWYRKKEPKTEVPGKKHKVFSFVNENTKNPAYLKKKINFMYDKKAFVNDGLTVSLLPSGRGKFIVSSMGKTINYTISFYDKYGKELITKQILSSLEEIDLSKKAVLSSYKVKLTTPFKNVEETIVVE